MTWEKLLPKDSVRNRSHAAVHPCRHTDPALTFQPHRAYDTDPHRGGNRRNGPLRQHPQRTLLALGIRQRRHITRTEQRIRVQETGTLPSAPSSGQRTRKETDHHSTQSGMITEATASQDESTGNRLSRRNRIFQRIRSV